MRSTNENGARRGAFTENRGARMRTTSCLAIAVLSAAALYCGDAAFAAQGQGGAAVQSRCGLGNRIQHIVYI